MRRPKRQSLRGSVTQNTTRVRMRAKETTPRMFLLRLGALVGSVFLVLGILAWVWHRGWPQHQAENISQAALHLTQYAHFRVRDIAVEGREHTGKDVLSAAIGVSLNDPILSFDPDAAHERITKLPWVANAIVERRLPDTIYVHLEEREPLARWQHGGHMSIIDKQGTELPDAKPEQFESLPLVVGADAPPETKALLDVLGDYPVVREKMTAAVRVGARRWDLHFSPNVTARLPERKVTSALKLLSSLISERKILERDISAIDLRLPDRLVIESAHPVSSHTGGV